MALRRGLIAGLCLLALSGQGLAQQPVPRGGVSPDQLPSAPVAPSDEPAAHAKKAGLGVCEGVLDKMSREIFRGPHAVQSGWNIKDPPNHVFQSVAGLRNASNKPPNAVAALIAAPNPVRDCDGVAVQIYPLAIPCASVQETAQKGGEMIANLEGVRVVLDNRKARLFFLPGGGATCVVVSVTSYFSAP